MTKLRIMRWASRVARVEVTTSVSNRRCNTWDVNVIWKVYLKEMKQKNKIQLAQDAVVW
jgi:hypothetical protein